MWKNLLRKTKPRLRAKKNIFSIVRRCFSEILSGDKVTALHRSCGEPCCYCAALVLNSVDRLGWCCPDTLIWFCKQWDTNSHRVTESLSFYWFAAVLSCYSWNLDQVCVRRARSKVKVEVNDNKTTVGPLLCNPLWSFSPSKSISCDLPLASQTQ